MSASNTKEKTMKKLKKQNISENVGFFFQNLEKQVKFASNKIEIFEKI